MKVISKLRHLRISPRKVRLVADLIRRKKTEEAQAILNFAIKKGSRPLLKLLKTAMADAKNNFQLDANNLYISKITVDGGAILKRWRPRSRGMANPIKKRTSHITLILEEIEPGKKLKEVKGIKEVKKDVIEKKDQPKFEHKPELETIKPKEVRGLKRVFRRKSI
ncbi:MAG: 50S ribosomal protein L22 [Candidatus Nealsonbacteria bacterium RBG_13_37_56]|uniref:Large ribosomal subunit protein uL22 n=1 Tax=Candidatus Nealsonbacteria bacterium RBG_13_37_56 TaxID=1801661 RepID=A0A1G2DXN5_9BACT|nr:MAG: 50S ribosomal protein L22 [Candidatus Nealsonbacteria bacterium RBG_13_37_56]